MVSLRSLFLELHAGNILIADECLYRFDKIGCDTPQEGRGGNLVAKVLRQEVRQLPPGL